MSSISFWAATLNSALLLKVRFPIDCCPHDAICSADFKGFDREASRGGTTMSIRRGLLRGLSAFLICCVCLGCETAHYVVRKPDSGCVAIPEDTPELRAKAEKLMHDQFPGGYVIDDVRVVPIGRPYRTVVQVGPVAEVQTHQPHEVLLTYHAGQPAPAIPVQEGAPVARVASPPAPLAPPTVQPASLTVPSALPSGLPPQPIPVN